MKVLILCTSLNRESRSRAMADRAREVFEARGAQTCLVDLHELDLPLCGGDAWQDHAQAIDLAERVRDADGVLIASPIYNFDVNAACKNAIELTGEAWENKVVGFLCVAGGQSGYMSVMSIANSLMLDFRCVIVPRFVYATGSAFRNGRIVDPDTDRRIEQLCGALSRLATAWGDRSAE